LPDRSLGEHFRERASAAIAGPNKTSNPFPALLVELGQSFVGINEPFQEILSTLSLLL
jgi:hypothetical protein